MSIKRMTRREFLRFAGVTSVGLVAAACAPAVPPAPVPATAPAVAPTSVPPAAPSATAVPAATAGAQAGGTLRIISTADAIVLGYTPNFTAYQDFMMFQPAIESLGRLDASGQIVPFLASAFKEDASAKTITITLRKGIKFHDGTDFNADAVKWNVDQFLASGRTEIKGVTSVDIVDDSTVRVNMAKWDNTMLGGLGYYAGPMISPAAFQKNGKDWALTHPVGTGPFQFVGWEREVSVKYKKFDGYWQKGKPYLDTVEFHIIKDPMVATASFKSKEADVFLSVPAQNAKDLEKAGGVQVLNLKTGQGAVIYGLMSDTVHPNSPFANVKVRQAVGYAIDNKTLVDTLLYGYATPTNQWGVPANWSYNPDVKGYPFNPDKAKQLLAEAGYPNGFKTKLTTNTRAPENVQVMTAIQGYLKAVGIDGQIDVLELGAWNLVATKNPWDGLIWWSSRADADLPLVMPRNLSAGGPTYSHGVMRVAKLDQMLADARVAPDFATKKALCMQLQQLVIDEMALFTPLYVAATLITKYPNVQNEGMNVTHGSTWTPEEAWLKV